MAKNTKTAPKNTEKQANKKKTEKANQESPSPHASKGQAIWVVSAAQLAKKRAGQGQKPTKEHGRSSDDPEDEAYQHDWKKKQARSIIDSLLLKGHPWVTKGWFQLRVSSVTFYFPRLILS